jgi:hypothetical protein
LVVNGSFENNGITWAPNYNNSGFGAMIVLQNSAVIPGWTVQNDQLDWDQSGAFGLFAQAGNYYLDLTDGERTGPAGVAQPILSTIPNARYLVSGWLGSSKDYNTGTTRPTITVNINGDDVQTSTGIGAQAQIHSYWEEFGLDFIATGTSTLLALQGWDCWWRNQRLFWPGQHFCFHGPRTHNDTRRRDAAPALRREYDPTPATQSRPGQ